MLVPLVPPKAEPTQCKGHAPNSLITNTAFVCTHTDGNFVDFLLQET